MQYLRMTTEKVAQVITFLHDFIMGPVNKLFSFS